MSESVLRLQGVAKSYGKTLALEGIDLSLERGEFVGLLGPNGAGKSTLFQIAGGLFAPDEGKVEVFGLDYRKHPAEILSRLGVVFQARSVDLDMTVKQNLTFHGQLFGLSGKVLAGRIAEVTELLEITDLVTRPVRTLSGGNQRRVEIARALINRPDLLLLDEPTIGLDAQTRRALVEHMQAFPASSGTTILWATHLVDEVEKADRVVLIAKGRIIESGTPDAVRNVAGTSDLTEAYIRLTGAVEGPGEGESASP